MLPKNIADFGRHKVRPLLRHTPDRVVIYNDGSVPGLGRRSVKFMQPPAGEPGRPFDRMLRRAFAEDAARKNRIPQRELVDADIASCKRTLPKATKLDR